MKAIDTGRTPKRVTGGVLLAAILIAAACTSSPTSPSSAEAPAVETTQVLLTVTVLERVSEVPIPGAAVSYNGRQTLTDAVGRAIVPVMAGEETAIDVSARTYESMGASGVLSNSERWTFYLAPQPAG